MALATRSFLEAQPARGVTGPIPWMELTAPPRRGAPLAYIASETGVPAATIRSEIEGLPGLRLSLEQHALFPQEGADPAGHTWWVFTETDPQVEALPVGATQPQTPQPPSPPAGASGDAAAGAAAAPHAPLPQEPQDTVMPAAGPVSDEEEGGDGAESLGTLEGEEAESERAAGLTEAPLAPEDAAAGIKEESAAPEPSEERPPAPPVPLEYRRPAPEVQTTGPAAGTGGGPAGLLAHIAASARPAAVPPLLPPGIPLAAVPASQPAAPAATSAGSTGPPASSALTVPFGPQTDLDNNTFVVIQVPGGPAGLVGWTPGPQTPMMASLGGPQAQELQHYVWTTLEDRAQNQGVDYDDFDVTSSRRGRVPPLVELLYTHRGARAAQVTLASGRCPRSGQMFHALALAGPQANRRRFALFLLCVQLRWRAVSVVDASELVTEVTFSHSRILEALCPAGEPAGAAMAEDLPPPPPLGPRPSPRSMAASLPPPPPSGPDPAGRNTPPPVPQQAATGGPLPWPVPATLPWGPAGSGAAPADSTADSAAAAAAPAAAAAAAAEPAGPPERSRSKSRNKMGATGRGWSAPAAAKDEEDSTPAAESIALPVPAGAPAAAAPTEPTAVLTVGTATAPAAASAAAPAAPPAAAPTQASADDPFQAWFAAGGGPTSKAMPGGRGRPAAGPPPPPPPPEARTRGPDPKRAKAGEREICKRWQKWTCHAGDDCKFLHI